MTQATDKQWRLTERCRITFEGRTVEGVVSLVSGGRAMAVSYEAVLGGCAGFMMLLWDRDRRRYLELFGRQPVELAEPELPERFCTVCASRGKQVRAAFVAADASGLEWFECDGEHDETDNADALRRVGRVAIEGWFKRLRGFGG